MKEEGGREGGDGSAMQESGKVFVLLSEDIYIMEEVTVLPVVPQSSHCLFLISAGGKQCSLFPYPILLSHLLILTTIVFTWLSFIVLLFFFSLSLVYFCLSLCLLFVFVCDLLSAWGLDGVGWGYCLTGGEG